MQIVKSCVPLYTYVNKDPIGPLQRAILLMIYKSKKALHVNELARLLDSKPASISISLKQLAERGYITTNGASRGKVKTLELGSIGPYALFAYGIDPNEYYSRKGENIPPAVDIINNLFKDKKVRSQTIRNVYSYLLQDVGTTRYEDHEIDQGLLEKDLTILTSISQIARIVIKYSHDAVDKKEYNHLLDTLLSHTERYVNRVKEEIQ